MHVKTDAEAMRNTGGVAYLIVCAHNLCPMRVCMDTGSLIFITSGNLYESERPSYLCISNSTWTPTTYTLSILKVPGKVSD